MRRASWRARLRYQFDKSMAAGPIALIGWLAVISLVAIIAAGLVLALTGIAPDGGEHLSFVEGAWESLMRTMDAGTMGGDIGWPFRGVSLVVTISGIFVFSALIGVLSSGLEEKLDDLRKGRSQVLENDHTIIFNWSPSIFDVISELVIANTSRRRPRIVIMAAKDKVEMEDELADKIENLRNTRIICRSGDPTDLYDINIVNPHTSRSIIVLSPEGDHADSEVIKTVLALVNDPGRRKEPYQIAAEIRDTRNAEVARIVGGKELQLVLADDLISRIVAHSSRQSGLSGVYSELLDFEGCEIYTLEQPELSGKSFGAAVMMYESSTLIGFCDNEGAVHLNPPANRIFLPGERAIIIAEDDAAIKSAAAEMRIDKEAIRGSSDTRDKGGAHADARLEPPRPDHRPRAVALCRPWFATHHRRRYARYRRGGSWPDACERQHGGHLPRHRYQQPRRTRRPRYSRLRPRACARLLRPHGRTARRHPHARHPFAATPDRRENRPPHRHRQRDDRRAQP
ncbi:CASTOR/POLLUX-related putative ion channel [Rhizobium ruizarguesonis]|uniref:CASTOR/POLLUX-related putative ion channel n=1 Tax=Rhizobium ruizarguesonis TaxID=2081791 RepID=UPI001FE0A3A0|nr:hypothetical protein [Rhizobium ruizarguesonis]